MDKFNDIWKDRFNQGDIPDADWNTPDKEVWEAILPHVPASEDRRRPLLFWIILGASILGIAILSYYLSSSKTISQHSMPATDSPVLAYVSNTNTGRTKEIKEHKDEAKKTTAILNTSVEATASAANLDNAQRVQKNVHSQDNLHNALQIRTESRGIDRVKLKDEHLGTDAPKARQETETVHENTVTEDVLLSPLPFVPTLLLPVEANEEPVITIPFKVIPNAIELPKPKRLKLAFESGATYWQHRISEQYTSDLSAFEFNYSDDWGWSTQAVISYDLNDKIAITGGIAYERISTTSGHNSNLVYDPTIEEGAMTNDYDASLATPYGIVGANFRFQREEELGDDPVDLLVDFHSKHTIQNVSVPVGVEVYPIGQRRKLIPSIGLGVGTNYLFGIENQIGSIDTNHDAIKYIKGENTSFNQPELERLHFDLRLAVGLEYMIQSDLNVGIQTNFARGINPIFELEDYETRINRYQVQLSLSKKF